MSNTDTVTVTATAAAAPTTSTDSSTSSSCSSSSSSSSSTSGSVAAPSGYHAIILNERSRIAEAAAGSADSLLNEMLTGIRHVARKQVEKQRKRSRNRARGKDEEDSITDEDRLPGEQTNIQINILLTMHSLGQVATNYAEEELERISVLTAQVAYQSAEERSKF